MRNRITMLCTWLVLTAGSSFGEPAKRMLEKGQTEFFQQAYEKALEHFEEAAELAEPSKRDPAVAHYNQGRTLIELDQLEDADQAFQQAVRSTDILLQSKAYYNQGCMLSNQAQGLEDEQQLEQALSSTQNALAMFERSVLLDPVDVDAKVNFELTQKKEEELSKLIEQQQQDQQQPSKGENKKDEDEDQGQDNQDKEQQQPEEDPEADQEEDQPQDDHQNQPPQDQQAQPKPEEMTQEEAKMLLDAMREEENAEREKFKIRLGKPVPVVKDW